VPDVLVLEARDRVGGRVEQVSVDDERPVQLGGEMIGQATPAYLGLVEELGLTLDLDVHVGGGRDDLRPRRRRQAVGRRLPVHHGGGACDYERRRAVVRRAGLHH
jgi:monoamine oxidase